MHTVTTVVLFRRDLRLHDHRAPAGAAARSRGPVIGRPVRALHRRQWLPRRLHETFEFFERPENLALITPPWLGFRLVTPGPITMARGLTLDYTIRVLGVRRHWRSEIVDYDPPYGFRDVQVVGPYRLWDHRHRFRRENGGTLVDDFVVYAPPLGPLGALLDVLVIRRQLAAIFDYRRRRLEDCLGEGSLVRR